jgi:hypothetical protein
VRITNADNAEKPLNATLLMGNNWSTYFLTSKAKNPSAKIEHTTVKLR